MYPSEHVWLGCVPFCKSNVFFVLLSCVAWCEVGSYFLLILTSLTVNMFYIIHVELELILSRWLWERGEKGGASLQKQARVRALCGVMQ